MRTQKTFLKSTTLTAIFLAVFVMGSYAQTSDDKEKDDREKREKITQAISTTVPSDGDQDVERDTPIEITLNEDMELDQETIENSTFVLKEKRSEQSERGQNGMQQDGQEDMQQDDDMQQEEQEETDYENETEFETDQRTSEDSQLSSNQDMKTIEGTIEFENNTARFIPNQTLRANTEYVLTMNTETADMGTTGQQEQDWQQQEQDQEQDQDWEQEQDQEQEWEQDQTQQDRELAQNQEQEWSVTFTTGGRDEPLEMVNLGSAGNYVVLANVIHNETTSDISGESGEVEEDEDGMGMNEEETTTEGAQTDTTDNEDGGMFSDDNETQTAAGDPNQALEDLRSAYEEVEQLSNPDFEDVFEGEISGKTLTPGLYKWSNTVEIDSVVTLSGSAEDIWVFQVSEDLNLNEDVEIQLEDGAVPENVIWQVAGQVALRSGSHAEGVLLTMNQINLENGASVNGRMLAVNDISMDQNTITEPDMFRADRRTGRTGPDGK
ncbi:MAG: ice-binding family protein [Balneolaceae bacterium]